ncbi:4'-phosphopantetheinyl transferase family protein [Methylobacterium durans]|uniref:4'-phosphopantetheinyl transferase family protein n=1 Tax=Methylobacterium durans TaxID=2202825 RepID=UPI001F01FBC0|nr:4'-phosphopantetheinyl transferase superfamily protein [Methylobacterium durans]
MSGGDWITAEPGPLRAATVWCVDLALSDAALAACAGILSGEERARAARFLRPVDRDRYVASHGALRLILGRACGRAPADLAFTALPGGKPALADGPGLDFNLSHSGARALVGLSPRGWIGVDVEALRPMPDAGRVARTTFAPDEVAALAALPASDLMPAFMACWTRKEAFVKAVGTGLAMPLARFSVSLPPAPASLLRLAGEPGAAEAWSLHHLEPGGGTVGAAALAGAGAMLDLRALPSGWPHRLL